ncbi:MAG: N-6 DNA methylase [Nitrososphaerota archaeon]
MLPPPNLNLDEIIACFKSSINSARTEEDLRLRISGLCIEEKILKPLGIVSIGKYEYTLVSGARTDALYGHVIIEYKVPGKISSQSGLEAAKNQLISYIITEAGNESRYPLFFGIIISDRIAFVRFDKRTRAWKSSGPYEVDRESIIKIIEALRGLKRKSLTASELIKDFGPSSAIATKAVRALYSRITSLSNERTQVLFQDWLRLLSQATGYESEKLKGIESIYSIQGKVDYNRLLFAIHTYYAIIMKMLAAEVVTIYSSGALYRSYIQEIENAWYSGPKRLKEILGELEEGSMFKNLFGLVNFIESDYFSWYVDLLDGEIGDLIAEIARSLANYEPATPQLQPEETRDLLKRLYQGLLPRDIRHGLGEYYTPDWLSELMLDEVGYTLENLEKIGKSGVLNPLNLKVLDPSCGSGTFIIQVIKRIREYAEEHFLSDTVGKYILNSVVGYDLNPLAVITARANYLLAVGDLISRIPGVKEIPVYLADSILIESKGSLEGKFYVLRTSVGQFDIPKSLIETGKLSEVLFEIERGVRVGYSERDMNISLQRFGIADNEINSIMDLYKKFTELEKEGKNRIWTSIIRNGFAPILKGRFDFIVGNPPWISWESLPEAYREISKGLWDYYGLAKTSGKVAMGKVKKDLSTLFLVRCLDLYLKDDGVLGFLIPSTVFKMQAAYGFRQFLSKGIQKESGRLGCSVIKTLDLVTLFPFEGAVNRTAAIVIKKSLSEFKPVENVIWNSSHGPIPEDYDLETVKKVTEQIDAKMFPVDQSDPASSWAQLDEPSYSALKSIMGVSDYRAHEGVNVGFNQIFFVKIVGRTSEGLVITNPVESGQKKKVKEVTMTIEEDLVFPLIRARDVTKWHYEFMDRYIILPIGKDGSHLKSEQMRHDYPHAWEYFSTFFNELVNRAGEPYKSRLSPYRKIEESKAEQVSPPFFWVFNAEDSLSKTKVVWKRVAGGITGKATSFASAVLSPITDKNIGERVVIPEDSLILVETEDETEAYYLTGVLNSTISKLLIAAYTYEIRQETHILDNVRIPKFVRNEKTLKIAELSKLASEIASKIAKGKEQTLQKNLQDVEEQIDSAVADFYHISEEQLCSIKRMFRGLSNEPRVVEVEETTGDPLNNLQ